MNQINPDFIGPDLKSCMFDFTSWGNKMTVLFNILLDSNEPYPTQCLAVSVYDPMVLWDSSHAVVFLFKVSELFEVTEVPSFFLSLDQITKLMFPYRDSIKAILWSVFIWGCTDCQPFLEPLEKHRLFFPFINLLNVKTPDLVLTGVPEVFLRTPSCSNSNCPSSDLWRAERDSSLAGHGHPDGVFGAPHLVGDEVVAESIQAAGDVGQTHGYLYEQADPGLIAAVLNDSLVHLRSVRGERSI